MKSVLGFLAKLQFYANIHVLEHDYFMDLLPSTVALGGQDAVQQG
jgi:hypothetical protein